ncbi:DUF1800 domain-containing protein [uncultured Pseudacidovorax sp.]|uniref:DUF1800 domain-containing protein n=1 Tax=uncultured Pseudacidovorax sp. TaxID=679313 RepID=UPI0025FC087A|nr:DUF1800 domain-containing protein [uncultured Pseudacidovorax sp.]
MAAQHDDPSHDRPPAARAGTRAALAAPSTAAPGAPTASLSILAASVLAACGGGGGGGGGGGFLPMAGAPAPAPASASGSTASPAPAPAGTSLTGLGNTVTAQSYRYLQPQTDAEAARFLLQAQFSASPDDIAAVRSKGCLVWLREQFDAPPSQGAWQWLETLPYRSTANTLDADAMAWKQLITSSDGVRQRVALALSEIFVVNSASIGTNWSEHAMAQYWDMLVAGTRGTFRQLLEAVTLNPAMGLYLNTRGNQKENASTGRQPDENYAREVMQLMTIGLVQLEQDGRARTDAAGKPLDSYTQDDVTNLARVFTGYDLDIRSGERGTVTLPGNGSAVESNAWTQRPMALNASLHSTLAASFLGTSVPAGTAGGPALRIALDALVAHPNTAPFIGRQLIQRLVCSNPSPAYVRRVADVFVDNGSGVRGDMRSVVAAVLLDNEARGPLGLNDPTYGRVREPMVRLVQWARTFGATSTAGTWRIGNLSNAAFALGQSPLRSPSVFNFFRPGYVPPSTALAAQGLVAPEFQIVNETSVGGYINFLANILQGGFNNRDVLASYTAEKALALDATALVERLALLLSAGQLSAATKAVIVDAIGDPALTGSSSDAARLNRVTSAVLLVMSCPEYLVQK